MTGMTLTLGERRRMSSISISRRLYHASISWGLGNRCPTDYFSCLLQDSRMASRGNEIYQCVNPVISKSWVTFNPRFFSQDIIILTFDIRQNLLKADTFHQPTFISHSESKWKASYQNSLSIPSPNPGVSTIVRAILTPSSSNSTLTGWILTPCSICASAAA